MRKKKQNAVRNRPAGRPASPAIDHASGLPPAALPLGALMLAASMSSWAQTPAQQPAKEQTLPTIEARGEREPTGKESLRVKTTSVGKGNQELRDIPQSVTVMTERLMDDRNLDDFREVLRNTAGVSFQAGETGEEDVRLRGFSLGQAGDIYTDGLRDGALYERDTFNNERVGSAQGVRPRCCSARARPAAWSTRSASSRS